MQDSEKISGIEIRNALARVLGSQVFEHSDRLRKFLRFAVEFALEKPDQPLKEMTIGTEVYHRAGDYHPSNDSIVRTEARRLRKKLSEYYEDSGKHDPVKFHFRAGSYIPAFERASANGKIEDLEELTSDDPDDPLYRRGEGIPLAVIPFVDLSGTESSGECARSITDEIAHLLMKTDGCRVAAARSVSQLCEQGLDVPTIAAKLGVQFVFEGSVRESNNQLRVTASVMNAKGFQICTERFDALADAGALFTVSERIASALVSRTRPELIKIRKSKASVSDAVIAEYPTLTSAEALLDRGAEEDLRAALARFREVSHSLPTYARPWGGIAQCCCELALIGLAGSAVHVKAAKEAAARALELDSQWISSFTVMACALALEWNWKAAREQFEAALQLGTNANTDRAFALFLAAQGNFDDAWHYLSRAQDFDPFSYRQKVACAKFFYLSRRADDASAHFSERHKFGALPAEARLYLARAYLQKGDVEKARKLAGEAHRDAANRAAIKAGVAEIAALSGDIAEAKRTIEASGILGASSPLSRHRKAALWTSLGQNERAIEELRLAVAEREAECVWLRVDPRFEAIRGSAEFQEILAETVM